MDPLRNATDQALVERVRAGDEEALEELIGRLQCVPRMLASKNAKLGRPLKEPELADLAQDVLVVIWRKLPEFQGRSSLETWVYGIALLELLWKLRKERRVPNLIEDLPSGAPEPLRDSEVPQIDFERIHDGLRRLDTDEAEVVRLKHFEDLSFTRIGEVLDVSPNTAKARYYRGLLKMRQLLGAEDRERTKGGPR